MDLMGLGFLQEGERPLDKAFFDHGTYSLFLDTHLL